MHSLAETKVDDNDTASLHTTLRVLYKNKNKEPPSRLCKTIPTVPKKGCTDFLTSQQLSTATDTALNDVVNAATSPR